ncbi:UMP kinase [Candidatus Bathyarchaeota archaeon]|nr:UMP kinase [Candidatus Bathyarchaeota archaeon]NIV43886.1 UMP kinase [Candidatus Bathyarchaeota archaeon]
MYACTVCMWGFTVKLVLRIGGSIVASPFDPALLSAYAELLMKLKHEGHTVAAVVGGGSLAREMIRVAQKMQLREPEQDEVAISVSRLVAQLLLMKLGDGGAESVPTSLEEAADSISHGKVVVMGGLTPGMTTDAVAAMLAEQIGADLLVKATDQDGIFTRDPRKHRDARKLDVLSFDDLTQFLESKKHEAGIHQILDPEAVHILKKRKTRTIILNGFDPRTVSLAVKGKKIGTVIS